VYSEKFDFETDAKYRDYITVINSLINKEKVIEFVTENKHIALIQFLNEDTFKLLLLSGSRVLFSKKYTLSDSNIESLKLTLSNKILFHFKNDDLNNLVEIGKDEIDEAQIIYSYLKSKQNNCKYIVIPKEWIDEVNDSYIYEALSTLLGK